MGMFDKFPYRNTRDLNLNWIIKKIRELEELIGGVVSNFAQFLSKKGGKMEGSIDMQGNRITNVPDPAADADSVNKRYVDRKTGNYLPLKGGKMLGEVDMDYKRIYHMPQPSYGSDVATKKYVDDMDSKYLSFSGGTMSGPVDMGNQKITNVPDPTADTDVATKKYVDEHGGGVTGDYLPLSGGTMSGPVNMGNQKITNVPDPTENQDVATKKYVDEHGGGVTGDYLPLSGGTMTGPVNMGNQKITNVPNPTENQDVATKKYVDENSGSVKEITYGQVTLYGYRYTATQCQFRIYLPFSATRENVNFENFSPYNLRVIDSGGTQVSLSITNSVIVLQSASGNIVDIVLSHNANSTLANKMYLYAKAELEPGFTVRKI